MKKISFVFKELYEKKLTIDQLTDIYFESNPEKIQKILEKTGFSLDEYKLKLKDGLSKKMVNQKEFFNFDEAENIWSLNQKGINEYFRIWEHNLVDYDNTAHINAFFRKNSHKLEQNFDEKLMFIEDYNIRKCYDHFNQRLIERFGRGVSYRCYWESWIKTIVGRFLYIDKNSMRRLIGNYHKDKTLAIIVYRKIEKLGIYVPLTFFQIEDQRKKFLNYAISIKYKDKDPLIGEDNFGKVY